MNKKTKNQSIFEYLDSLQCEYVVTELRKKICPIVKIKQTYKSVCERKREKIENISMKNRLPNIFTDEDVERKFYEEVYNEWGLPSFTYTSEQDKLSKYAYDVRNYLAEGSEIKALMDNGEISIGTIIDVDYVEEWLNHNKEELPENTTILIKIKGSSKEEIALVSRIARIL